MPTLDDLATHLRPQALARINDAAYRVTSLRTALSQDETIIGYRCAIMDADCKGYLLEVRPRATFAPIRLLQRVGRPKQAVRFNNPPHTWQEGYTLQIKGRYEYQTLEGQWRLFRYILYTRQGGQMIQLEQFGGGPWSVMKVQEISAANVQLL